MFYLFILNHVYLFVFLPSPEDIRGVGFLAIVFIPLRYGRRAEPTDDISQNTALSKLGEYWIPEEVLAYEKPKLQPKLCLTSEKPFRN